MSLYYLLYLPVFLSFLIYWPSYRLESLEVARPPWQQINYSAINSYLCYWWLRNTAVLTMSLGKVKIVTGFVGLAMGTSAALRHVTQWEALMSPSTELLELNVSFTSRVCAPLVNSEEILRMFQKTFPMIKFWLFLLFCCCCLFAVITYASLNTFARIFWSTCVMCL